MIKMSFYHLSPISCSLHWLLAAFYYLQQYSSHAIYTTLTHPDDNSFALGFVWLFYVSTIRPLVSFCLSVHRGKIVLGYTEAELCYRGSGYQFIHAADMLHCAENHIRSKFFGLL